jgi:hypothetical protein
MKEAMKNKNCIFFIFLNCRNTVTKLSLFNSGCTLTCQSFCCLRSINSVELKLLNNFWSSVKDRRKKLYKSLAMKHGFITMILRANRNPCNGKIRVLHPQRSLKSSTLQARLWPRSFGTLVDRLPPT